MLNEGGLVNLQSITHRLKLPVSVLFVFGF